MSHICYHCFQQTADENGICSACGFDSAKNREQFPLSLPMGSILFGRYIVGRCLGQGGFGITYLAQDYQTKELVAIKEFFPSSMASRNGTTVHPYSGAQGENFNYGKNTFLDEAKTMAEFNGNPNIAGVQVYFEENGTAYFVMEYLDGCSFGQYIAAHGGRLSWDDIIKIMTPVLEALSQIHEKGLIHRDIAPDNIYITRDGAVKVLDFGAARHSLGNVSQSLDVVVKHGFAPKEQYSRRGRQGPYTDVYAACATMYYALTGVKPDESIDRADNDTMPAPSILGAKISPETEAVLMQGLAVYPADRFQTVAEFRGALMAASEKKVQPVVEKQPRISEPVVAVPASEPVNSQRNQPAKAMPKWLPLAAAAVVLVIALLVFIGGNGRAEENIQLSTTPTETLASLPSEETTQATEQSHLSTDDVSIIIPDETEPVVKTETVSLRTKISLYNGDGNVYECDEYTYNEYGEKIGYKIFNPDGSLDGIWEYVYDEHGNQTGQKHYNSDGSINIWYNLTYDSKGNKLTEHVYFSSSGLQYWFEYSYNEKNQMVKTITHAPDGSIKSWSEKEYDENGNQLSLYQYNNDGALQSWAEYSYDDQGNRVLYISYKADGTIDYYYESTYDQNGNKLSYTRFDGNGTKTSMSLYTYDAKGNSTSNQYFYKNFSTPQDNYIFENSYDENGYLIKHVSINNDTGKVSYIEEYTVMQVLVRDSANQ